MSGAGESWARRAARAEANTRRINEAIEAGTAADEMVFVCECGELDCGTTVPLSRDEYEAVRTDFDRFLLTPGHELPAIEAVVESHERYLVVRKINPEAREVADATDPRDEG
jgi:hypothetical protein